MRCEKLVLRWASVVPSYERCEEVLMEARNTGNVVVELWGLDTLSMATDIGYCDEHLLR